MDIKINREITNGSINPAFRNTEHVLSFIENKYESGHLRRNALVSIVLSVVLREKVSNIPVDLIYSARKDSLVAMLNQHFRDKDKNEVRLYSFENKSKFEIAWNLFGLDFSVALEYGELLNAISFVGKYNEFDTDRIIPVVQTFLSSRFYYNDDNCNNFGHLFDFSFGREGSPVLYVTWRKAKKYEANLYNQEYSEVDMIALLNNMEIASDLMRCDEFSFEESEHKAIFRFWWD